MIEAMTLAILIGAGLVALSIFTSVISFRMGAPLLLVFLVLGLLAGEDGPGGIDFDNAAAAYFIGSMALAVILFDSGFETRLHSVRVAWAPSLTLATVGVALTAALLGVFAHLVFGLTWLEGLLLGAIIGSTDAAAVFFLLRVGGITLKERVRATLEVESGSNDPMAIFLTMTLVELAAAQSMPDLIGWDLPLLLLQQMGLGVLLGLVGGYGIVQAVNHIRLDPGLYPLAVLSLALSLFAAVTMIGGSGFLAVYIAGLVAGNMRLRHSQSLRRFQSGTTWLCQIAMFLTLGLLATPSTFIDVAPAAIVLALFLIFVARPLAVWLCMLPFGFARRETGFIAWVGLRGAVSILLGILPLLEGLPHGQAMFNIVFIMVLISLLVQGWTVAPVARRLGQMVPPRRGPVERVEMELPGDAAQDLVVYHITVDSPVLHGERLPRWARPSLIVRRGQTYSIHNAGALQAGDYVYLFAQRRRADLLDHLFAQPASAEAEAFFGEFEVAGDAALTDLGRAYGFEPRPEHAGLTAMDLFHREFGGRVEVGDRIAIGGIELVVRSLTNEARGAGAAGGERDGDAAARIGIVLDPRSAPQPGMPSLRMVVPRLPSLRASAPSLRPVVASLRRRLGGLRRRKAAARSAEADGDD
ncbi:MAG: hypothetical protein RLY86_531 [Pseudomonadota bacterium]|jgi:cell volume regulation protein A